MSYRIAYFISSHGLGHAARAAAVMEAILEVDPTVRFEIFTTAPEWFFQETLPGSFAYHPELTDIGLVQQDPFCEDVSKTVDRLDNFLPFDPAQVQSIAQRVSESRCALILCDISPMGVAVGQAAGISSVLIENFTWDWIYQPYTEREPRFAPHIEYLESLFSQADHHIQTEPVCRLQRADLLTPPVSRKRRISAHEIRKKLEIAEDLPVVLITMGGIPRQYTIQEKLKAQPNLMFVIPGGGRSIHREDNLVVLPYHSPFYHPDLIHAADVVIGKAGYSTLAEVYAAGVPFVFVNRPTFRESKIIEDYILTYMNGMAITEAQFEKGTWLSDLPYLLSSERIRRNDISGAQQVAEYIHRLLK